MTPDRYKYPSLAKPDSDGAYCFHVQRRISSRVRDFFGDQSQLLEGQGNHLIIGHRNVNKMILKSLLGLSFEEGFRVEHEHQRLYFYFCAPKELWSCRMGSTVSRFEKGYATTVGDSYA